MWHEAGPAWQFYLPMHYLLKRSLFTKIHKQLQYPPLQNRQFLSGEHLSFTILPMPMSLFLPIPTPLRYILTIRIIRRSN